MSSPMTPEAPSTTSAGPASAIEAVLRRAIHAALGRGFEDVDPMLRPSQRPDLADFQSNCAMALAKQAARNPRDLAQQIVREATDLLALCEPPEVAGPGFINLRLRPSALAAALDAMEAGDLGIVRDLDTHPVVIDLCAVNVAKQMHVGHLRSCIIGDALARAYERRGRPVFRENHLGDWGLPIAMVLHRLRRRGADLRTISLEDLDRAYRAAQAEGRADPAGLEAARRFRAGPHRIAELEEQNEGAQETVDGARRLLVALQQGDPDLERDWRLLIDCTLRALFDAIRILGVRLGPEHNRGESFYRDRLAATVAAFEQAGVAEVHDGALVVRFDDRERPLLIRKSDGGFLYATTDLAAIRFRTHELNASRIVYVVDARQKDHFRDVFDACRRMGWDRTPDGVQAELVHIGFGSVLGPDRRPLKTRSGENVTLRSLLDEACARGHAEVRQRAAQEKSPTAGLPDEDLREIGRMVGIAAIKYADLSSDLVRDYVFDMDRLIAFEGNTGPYLQYAHARICSILARAAEEGIEASAWRTAPFRIEEPAEKALTLLLLRYGAVMTDMTRSLEPHRLCGYLFDLSNAYSAFYQSCPVLRPDDPSLRLPRLRLCDLARRVLADGLDVLGLAAPTRM